MDFEATLWTLGISLAVLGGSVLGARKKPRGFRVGFVPWHALLFLSLAASLLMTAHLLVVWPR